MLSARTILDIPSSMKNDYITTTMQEKKPSCWLPTIHFLPANQLFRFSVFLCYVIFGTRHLFFLFLYFIFILYTILHVYHHFFTTEYWLEGTNCIFYTVHSRLIPEEAFAPKVSISVFVIMTSNLHKCNLNTCLCYHCVCTKACRMKCDRRCAGTIQIVYHLSHLLPRQELQHSNGRIQPIFWNTTRPKMVLLLDGRAHQSDVFSLK